MWINELERHHIQRIADATSYIREIGPEKFARCAFPLPRYGKVTSNLVEVINSAIKPIREGPPLVIARELWNYMMKTYAARKVEACHPEKFSNKLTTYALIRYRENEANCQSFDVLASDATNALVTSTSSAHQFHVRLHPECSCSCLEFQDTCWPCTHVMAWDVITGMDSQKLVDPIWINDFIRKIYKSSIPVVKNDELIPSWDCRPPLPAVRRGRHRYVRIPGGRGGEIRRGQGGGEEISYPVHEEFVNEDDVGSGQHEYIPQRGPLGIRNGRRAPTTRVARTFERRCGHCALQGHNRKTCQVLKADQLVGRSISDVPTRRRPDASRFVAEYGNQTRLYSGVESLYSQETRADTTEELNVKGSVVSGGNLVQSTMENVSTPMDLGNSASNRIPNSLVFPSVSLVYGKSESDEESDDCEDQNTSISLVELGTDSQWNPEEEAFYISLAEEAAKECQIAERNL